MYQNHQSLSSVFRTRVYWLLLVPYKLTSDVFVGGPTLIHIVNQLHILLLFELVVSIDQSYIHECLTGVQWG